MPDHIKCRMKKFQITYSQKILKTEESKELIVPPKYINIEKLDENFTITLNIDISDYLQ